jgi:hypothetical protein
MGKLERLEAEVQSLTPAEQVAFREWYAAFSADAWDAKIEADARSGKLDHLAQQARAAYDRGKTKPL